MTQETEVRVAPAGAVRVVALGAVRVVPAGLPGPQGPPGADGGVIDGNKGDIVVSGAGSIWTIKDDFALDGGNF